MTDKNEFDQEELNVAFERLNQSDGLQPSAELDALILQMAADEVQGASVEDEKSNVSDITDISFRRGQRETHKALKKKGLFPNWVMPMGLAATVLLSFGVVNRVLLSPEFDNLTTQSSYEAVSDEVVVTSAANGKTSTIQDSAGLNNPEMPSPVTMSQADNTKAKLTVNGNEMDADISFADEPTQSPSMDYASPNLDAVKKQSFPVDKKAQSESKADMVSPVVEFQTAPTVNLEKQEQDSRQEQHALLAKEKQKRLSQARRSAPVQPEIQVAVAEAPTGFSVPEPAPSVSNSGASISGVTLADAEETLAARADDSAYELESPDADSLEEVVVTGARIESDSNVSADSAMQMKREVLKSVLFEHKHCQVKQDCALVALNCDSCDCLEPLNNEHYNKYISEFSQSEIAEQCINTDVECVRNYCQVQQTE